MPDLRGHQKPFLGLALVALLVWVLASTAWAAAPELTITSPADGSKVTTAKVDVTGTYSGFTGDHCSRHAGERYRAVAPETRSGNDICLPVTSKAVKTF